MIGVDVSIVIDGVKDSILASSVKIHSPYNAHHTFEVLVPLSQIDAVGIPDIKAMLGEKVMILIRPDDGRKQKCCFVGMVYEICPTWSPQGRMLAIKGYSPTILLDKAPAFRTIKEESLGQCVRKVINGRLAPVEIQNSSERIDWRLQPNQTDYQFLLALADEYNKVMAYDGTKLIFGDLGQSSSKEITLCQENDLLSLRLSLNLCPLNLQLIGFDLEANQVLSPISSNGLSSKNQLVSAAIEKAGIYPAYRLFWPERMDKEEQKKQFRRIETCQAHQMVQLFGESSNLDIKVGSVVSIDTDDNLLQGAFEGLYLILQVEHFVVNDSYRNAWVAVPVDHPYPVRMQNTRNPICGPRLAFVKEVEKGGLGRLKVTFVGDPEENVSPSIPAITAFSSDGGAFTPPQPRELVVVFFENFNPQKPIVMGSLFYGGKKADRWDNGKRGFSFGGVAFEVDGQGKLIITAEVMELVAKKMMELRSEGKTTLKGTTLHFNPQT